MVINRLYKQIIDTVKKNVFNLKKYVSISQLLKRN